MVPLIVPEQIRAAMFAHSRFTYPDEACGLLAGDGSGKLRMVYCLTNAQPSPSSYTIEPREHFRALQHADANGWELVGAFHSHPHSAAFPSETDRRLAGEPDWVYFIVALTNPPELRGFHLRGGSVTEVELRVGA